MQKIPLIKPYITEEVKLKVCEVLDSGYLTEGPVTREFEDSIKEYIGCKYALAVCNCTVGIEIGLRALGIGPGDEVIVPDYTYPATASVVEIVGAKIVIVDVDHKTMLINYQALEQAITPKTKAIIPVSIFGNPLDYEQLNKIKKKYNLYILEDAACSIGTKYDEMFAGNLADISVFSFHPRKFITTGEGGMVTTNNYQWAKLMDSYKHFGVSRKYQERRPQFERIGTNYKLSDIQAAVGLVQMRYINSLLDKRSKIAQSYYGLLKDIPDLSFPETTIKGTHSWQSFCVFAKKRDEIIQRLKTKDIETQIGTYSLHMHQAFNQNPNCKIAGDMSGSRYVYEHCLSLPMYQDMTEDEQAYVVRQLLELLA